MVKLSSGGGRGKPSAAVFAGPVLWVLLTSLAVTAAQAESHDAGAPACSPTAVHLFAETGVVTYSVEIADDPAEQARGLMFRPSLPADAGMLFIFDPPRPASFWMRNTMIPLDMIFIGDDGKVVNVAERTIPYSEASQNSDGPVRAVLEVNGGEAARLGIGPGTAVRHPAFAAATGANRCPQ